jgi:DHA3 family tetracycline resistance protein-like MFS transporter
VPAFAVYVIYNAVSSFAHATAFTLYLVYQVEDVGLNPLQLVLAGTALEVVCFVAQVPTGVIADLYSRRLSIIIGFILCGLGAGVPAIAPTYAAVLIGTALWGVGITCVDGADQAWVADEVGRRGSGGRWFAASSPARPRRSSASPPRSACPPGGCGCRSWSAVPSGSSSASRWCS